MPGVFCAKGISCVEVTKKGCICPSCRVYKIHSLHGSYYCVQIKVKTPPEDKKDILVMPHEEKVPAGV
jgi:hypothetical protein